MYPIANSFGIIRHRVLSQRLHLRPTTPFHNCIFPLTFSSTISGMASKNHTSPPFAETLLSITQAKFDVLSAHNAEFSKHLSTVRQARNNPALSANEKLQVILDVKKLNPLRLLCATTGTLCEDVKLQKLATVDPSTSGSLVEGWANELADQFERENKQFELGGLFGKLLQEWLQKQEENLELEGEAGATVAGDGDFEKVGRKEMHEQRKIFEELAFTPNETDSTAIKKYLDDLFLDPDTKEPTESLSALRAKIEEGVRNFVSSIEVEEIEESIQQLLNETLLSNQKSATLKQFSENKVVLQEFTDVIKIYLASFETWEWPEKGIPLEMRRAINGKYRFHMDEELLVAVFLQHLGKFWSRYFYRAFTEVLTKSWQSPAIADLSTEQFERRRAFLKATKLRAKSEINKKSIAGIRANLQKTKYFMNQLGALADWKARGNYEDAEREDDNEPALKERLLHQIVADTYANTNIHGQHTIVRSDFEWFGPSLSHKAILTILEYFGLPPVWIKFFKTFLETPVKFAHDGPDAQIRVRKRGAPISHTLSSMCGEVMLFCMEYAVNTKCDGTFLYRIHDDLWLWSSDQTRCVKAWETMKEFSSVVGLKFNEEKSGSLCIGGALDPRLPTGTIRWGFLQMDEFGKFFIDQTQVTPHIAEFRLQLGACKSLFSWIKAYDKYMGFFLRNFGKPTVCLGTGHLDACEATLRRIHMEVFPEHDGSVVAYIKSVLEERFGATNIPTGWIFWHSKAGGLGLVNPFISIAMLRASGEIPEYPLDTRKWYVNMRDRLEYESYKKNYEEQAIGKKTTEYIKWGEEFMSFEEYLLGREGYCDRWGRAYRTMLTESVTEKGLSGYPKKPFDRNDPMASPYWTWIQTLWGQDMLDRCGAYSIKDGLLPLGIVQGFKKESVMWEQ